MKNIVVTGARGMIATALIKYALNKDYGVIAFLRKGTFLRDEIAEDKRVQTVYADLSDYASFKHCGNAEMFFHLAWDKTSVSGRDDVAVQEKNIAYCIDAVNLAYNYGCRAFVSAGSQAEFGIKNVKLDSSVISNPESAYGIAKYAAEKLCRLRAAQLNIKYNGCRFLSVYGKYDAETTLISYLIKCFESGETALLTPCGQVWDYINAEDAARAMFLIGEKGIDGKSYAVGSGEERKLKDYVEDIRRIFDGKAEYGAKPYYPHQPMYLCADKTELEKDLDFKPEISFAEGIRRII